MKVLKTEDYEIFNFLPYNRQINFSHVSRLVKALKHKDVSEKLPILCNKDMEIVDGQHRFMALKQLGKPIYYIHDTSLGVDESKNMVQILNSCHRDWEQIDHIKLHQQIGDKKFLIINALSKAHQLSEKIVCALFCFNLSSQKRRDMKNGIYHEVHSAKRWDEILTMIVECVNIIFNNTSNIPRSISMYKALYMLINMDGYDHNLFIHKLSIRISQIYRCQSPSDYRNMFMNIYNYWNKKQLVL